jgi:protease I
MNADSALRGGYQLHRRLPGRGWRSALLRRVRDGIDRMLDQAANHERVSGNGADPSEALGDLTGKRIAILVAQGFQQGELTEPMRALRRAGAETDVVSPEHGTVSGWSNRRWGEPFRVDVPLEDADPEQYDGLLLPGGLMSADRLRCDTRAQRFARAFHDAGRPVAAICHGPQLLIEAGLVRGRRLTSYHSIRTDLENAGAHWIDEEVVLDDGLVTSRRPADLPTFNRAMVQAFARGRTQLHVSAG